MRIEDLGIPSLAVATIAAVIVICRRCKPNARTDALTAYKINALTPMIKRAKPATYCPICSRQIKIIPRLVGIFVSGYIAFAIMTTIIAVRLARQNLIAGHMAGPHHGEGFPASP